MKFRHEVTYDAPPAAVFEMLADPSFREAACAAQDVISADVAIEREAWADSTGGTLRIDAPGKPSEVKGTITLRPEGSGTVEIVELELKIKVPVIGGKLEKLLAEKVRAGMEAEHGVGVTYLEGNR